MTNAILGLIVAALAIAGMSIGLILRNKPLQPSCGGVYLSKGDTCQVCGKVISNWKDPNDQSYHKGIMF